jgi:hypothetical protein
MTPHTTHLGVIQDDYTRMMGSSPDAPLAETQLQPRQQLVHHDTAIAATNNMVQDPNLENVH